MNYSPVQKVLASILKGKGEILSSLREEFPDTKDIPGCGATERSVLSVMYSSGPATLSELDLKTNGKYHDALADLATLKVEDPEKEIRILCEERDRLSMAVTLQLGMSKLFSGTSPVDVASMVAGSISKVSKLEAPSWVQQVDSAKSYLNDMLNRGVELDSGITGLDANLTWRRGQLVVVAAPTSHGKTAFASRMALRALQRGLRVVFLEMEDYSTLPMKLASQRFQVPMDWFTRYHVVEQAQRDEVDQKLELLKQYADRLLILPDTTLAALKREAVAFRADMIVVDYLQKYVERYAKEDGKREAAGRATSDAQDIGRAANAFTILCSQIVRRERTGGTPRKPGLYDLKESGDIENYADVVLSLYWPYKDAVDKKWEDLNRGDYTISILKNKMGVCKEVEAVFTGETLTLKNPYTSEEYNAD